MELPHTHHSFSRSIWQKLSCERANNFDCIFIAVGERPNNGIHELRFTSGMWFSLHPLCSENGNRLKSLQHFRGNFSSLRWVEKNPKFLLLHRLNNCRGVSVRVVVWHAIWAWTWPTFPTSGSNRRRHRIFFQKWHRRRCNWCNAISRKSNELQPKWSVKQ